MQKPVYCLSEPAMTPVLTGDEAAQAQQENGSNHPELWAFGLPKMNTLDGGPNNVNNQIGQI